VSGSERAREVSGQAPEESPERGDLLLVPLLSEQRLGLRGQRAGALLYEAQPRFALALVEACDLVDSATLAVFGVNSRRSS
jgi:hypothetical protein